MILEEEFANHNADAMSLSINKVFARPVLMVNLQMHLDTIVREKLTHAEEIKYGEIN